MNLTANERRALTELAKPVGKRDYSRVHGITRHALERKGLFGQNGKPGGAITAAGRAELVVPDIFDDLFSKKDFSMPKLSTKGLPAKQALAAADKIIEAALSRDRASKKPVKPISVMKKEPVDAFRQIAHVETTLHDIVHERWEKGADEEGVRLYNTQSPKMFDQPGREGARWGLQVFSWVKTKAGRGKHFAIGTASMSREDLKWLRDLIDAELRRKS
jgi:hypothetical protein